MRNSDRDNEPVHILARRGWLLAAVLLLCAQPGFAQAPAQSTPPVGVEGRPFNVKFGVDYFMQVSSRGDYPFNDERFSDSETFMWERLKPRVSGTKGRVSFLLEGQDTHSVGGAFAVRKAWIDLLNARIDVQPTRGLVIRLGRQQGESDSTPRLMRTSDFAPVMRSFDVAELRWQRGQTDLRASLYQTVDNLPSRFNTWKKGERIWTVYGQRRVGRQRVSSFLSTRVNSDVKSESGVVGSGAVFAWEVMAAGQAKLPNVTYLIEHILERGHTSTDDLRASALFGSLAVSLGRAGDWDMRYVRTSGDAAAGDGKKGSFDPFYMAVAALSSLSLQRGPNLHAVSFGSSHNVARDTVFQWRYHEHHLTTLSDRWYTGATKVASLLRPEATSSRIGGEINFTLIYNPSPKLTIRSGYYRLLPGAYLTQTGSSGTPYEIRFQIFGTF